MFKKIFFEHPNSVGESYTEHQTFALDVSFQLFIAAFACLIHALVPALFERTASTIVNEVYSIMQKKRAPRGPLET